MYFLVEYKGKYAIPGKVQRNYVRPGRLKGEV